ncbi:MAG: hypothetical protein WD894_03630 [Pirellulales bacterium]
MSPSGTTAGLGLYRAKPYENDGGFSVQGLALTTGVGVLVAVVMGVVAAIVGQFFYAVFIFPLFIGAAVGAGQTWAIRHTKIRTPLACGAAGLVAGVVAVTTMHYVDYVNFRQGMNEANFEEQSLREAIADTTDPKERQYLHEVLAEFESDPEVVAAMQVNSFTSYLDWSARQGVEISSAYGNSGGLNLGHTGTFIYWGVEALIVALISAAMARRRAGAPFCVACDAWKTERELGWLLAPAKAVGEVVQSGRLAELPAMAGTSDGQSSISVYECPSCPEQADVVLEVNAITYNHGTREKSPQARAIYPRGAAADLTRYFVSLEDTPISGNNDTAVARKVETVADGQQTGELVASNR